MSTTGEPGKGGGAGGWATVDARTWERLGEIEQRISRASEDVGKYAERRQADDRSLIAKIVIVMFAVCISVVMIFIVLAVVFSMQNWEAPLKYFVDLIGSVVLPVVTLVIGFYFGTKSA